ncbi:hypothetical protein KUV57_23650 [Epibacterium sp. DP7N7-1]|nr:hypothetical protein [Epibacterium sp. DP7N7-1]
MFVEFKEKTFESYFVSELSRKSKTFYCPDQTDELHLGFDSMFYIPYWRHHLSLRYFDVGAWLRGITPDEVASMGKHFNRAYPNLKANMFFQFKRPELLTTQNAKEWEHWSSPYFRFSLYQHQHDILIELSRCTSEKAKVLYAAPKLARTADLLNAAKGKKVIKKTQVVEASKLVGHKKCTYSSASNTALGHSEPEEIATFLVADFLEEMASLDGESFTQASKRVGSEIKEALVDSNDAKQILHSARSIATDGWVDDMPQEFRDSWLDQLITVHAFSRAFGITTCFLG